MSESPMTGLDPFVMEVGSLGLLLTTSSPALLEQVRLRYGDYSGQGPVHLRAQIDIQHSAGGASLLDIPPVFENGAARLEAPGCRAWIDAQRGEAALSLRTAQPVEQLEYFLRLAVALLAFEVGGLLFHAAGVVRRGSGLAFFGYSGSGKSTIARLSSQGPAANAAVVLNDDLVLLMPQAGGWLICATPFWNQPAPRPIAGSAPLAGLFRLVQDQRVFLEPMPVSLAVAEMLTSMPVVSGDPHRAAALLERCQDIADRTPAYRLHFLPDPSFWALLDSDL